MQMHLRTSRDLLILVTNGLEAEQGNTVCAMNGGVAEWLRRSVSNIVGLSAWVRIQIVGTTKNKPTANSAVHPSEVGK